MVIERVVRRPQKNVAFEGLKEWKNRVTVESEAVELDE
jgi:hypothetical protein